MVVAEYEPREPTTSLKMVDTVSEITTIVILVFQSLLLAPQSVCPH